jgi:Flp pilus assembly protein TadG
MICPNRHQKRRGVVLVECSIIYIVVFLLILGAISIGFGIFRYQQLAWLAGEGARWASVHGPKYQSEQNAAAPTSQDVITNVIKPNLLLLNLNDLTCTLSMTSGVATVTLSYTWTPEVFLSPVTFKSKSVFPITY